MQQNSFLSKIFLLTNSFLIILVMLSPDHFCRHIRIMTTGWNISVKVSYIPTPYGICLLSVCCVSCPFNYYITIRYLACFFCLGARSSKEACRIMPASGFTAIATNWGIPKITKVIGHKAALSSRCCRSCCCHYCRSCDSQW